MKDTDSSSCACCANGLTKTEANLWKGSMNLLLSNFPENRNPAKGRMPKRAMLAVQANFHTTLSGEAMITLIYHKKLGDDWREAAEKLRTILTAAVAATAPVSVIGRSRGQKLICGEDYVTERLTPPIFAEFSFEWCVIVYTCLTYGHNCHI